MTGFRIERPQHIQDVVTRPGWSLPFTGLGQGAQCAIENAIHRVRPEPQGRRMSWLQQASRTQLHMRNGAAGAVI